MAGQSGTPPHIVELLEEIRREPFSFDFYQAVRLLDCAHQATPQTGLSESPTEDPFRLSQEPSLAFAPATVAEMEHASDFHPPRLVQRFFGLFGPQGALPLHLTDYARGRIRHYDDHTFYRFLDTFHHRMLAFFYRAWAQVRPTVNHDLGVRDRFGEYVAATFGYGMDSLTNRDSFPDLPKRHFSGLLSCQTRHADGLLAILQGYYGLPVELEQLVGQWIELPDECTCRLGESPAVSALGQSITMGSHIWDCQQKFRIEFGPLQLEDFFQFLPMPVKVLPASDTASHTSATQDPGDTEPALNPIAESVTPRSEEVDQPVEELRSGPFADAFYYNGQFFTGDEARPWAECVATHEGKTLAIGSLQDVRRALSDGTRVFDLQGALVVPDLELQAGEPQESSRPAMNSLPTRVQVQSNEDGDAWHVLARAVCEAARRTQAGSWMDVRGLTSHDLPELSQAMLDDLAPDHPLLVQFDDESECIALNTLALSVLRADAALESKWDDLSKSTDRGDVLRGELATAAIQVLAAGVPGSSIPKSECELAPQPSDRWHFLEAKLRQKLHQDGSQAIAADSPNFGQHDDATLSTEDRARIASLQRVLQELTVTPLCASLATGLPTEFPTNMLVVSQDLFQLAKENALDHIRDTRTVMVIRRGEVVYDLLAAQGNKREQAAVYGDVKHQFHEAAPVSDSPTTVFGDRDAFSTATSRVSDSAKSESKPSARYSLDSLIALVRTYVGDTLKWDVRLVLQDSETPPIGLGLQGHLGWSTWLLRDPIDRNPTDLILDAMEVERGSLEKDYEYQKVDQWDYRAVGQTANGQLLMADCEDRSTNE